MEGQGDEWDWSAWYEIHKESIKVRKRREREEEEREKERKEEEEKEEEGEEEEGKAEAAATIQLPDRQGKKWRCYTFRSFLVSMCATSLSCV